MAYDEQLAARVRDHLALEPDVVEKKMFGGLAFMVRGHMCCGVNGGDLMVRVGADAHDHLLAEPHARPMDFTGRPMKGMLYVASGGTDADADLGRWVERGLADARSRPPKVGTPGSGVPKARNGSGP
jgi:TfoX/Sxy family transcriptional regulator of competence genes